MESSIHIFIIWENALKHTEKLLDDIKNHFTIKEIFEVSWSKENFIKNLRRFYGSTLPKPQNKAKLCGMGKFLVIIIEDKQPTIDWRKTSVGKQLVNTNVYDLKRVYRRWIGGEFPIHGSINKKETDHDLTLIFGKNLNDFQKSLPKEWDKKIKSFNEDLVGTNNWNNLSELFYVLNSTTNYLVLRNFEDLPDKIDLDIHKDIDLLTDDKWQINYILNRQILKDSKGNARPYLLVNDKKISIDLRYVGDRYYDETWSRKMLEKRQKTKTNVYCPNSKDYFYSLLYHVLVHKSKISPDYVPKLVRLAQKIGINNLTEKTFEKREDLIKILNTFLKKNRYKFTDSFSYKIRHNEFVRLSDVAIKTSKQEGFRHLLRASKGKIKRKFLGV